MENNTALKKMIGKLPKNWESMSPEDKIRTVLKKWYLIFCDDSFSVDPDYFDIRIVGYGWGDYKPILAFKSLLSNETPYFVFKNPVPGKKFDMTRFPDYLRKIIKKEACKNWDTDERDYNILYAETDSAKTFAEAMENVKKIGFANIHCFAYSPRPGTVAAGLPGRIAPETVKKRMAELRRIAAVSSAEFARSQCGQYAPLRRAS